MTTTWNAFANLQETVIPLNIWLLTSSKIKQIFTDTLNLDLWFFWGIIWDDSCYETVIYSVIAFALCKHVI